MDIHLLRKDDPLELGAIYQYIKMQARALEYVGFQVLISASRTGEVRQLEFSPVSIWGDPGDAFEQAPEERRIQAEKETLEM